MSTAIHPSSWSNRALRDHAAETGRRPWQTGNDELALVIWATVTAVQEAMPHLSGDAILVPPHTWFDAALARQMMVFVLNSEFFVPKRVIASVSLMSRESICRGLRTVEARRDTEEFDAVLTRIQARASELYRLRRLS